MVTTRSMGREAAAGKPGTKAPPKHLKRPRVKYIKLEGLLSTKRVENLAFPIYGEETYWKRLRENQPDIKITQEVLKAAEDEFRSLSESDKAIYITQAKKKFAEIEKILDENPFFPEQKSERDWMTAEEDLIEESYDIFMRDIFLPQLRETHPFRFCSTGRPWDLATLTGRVKWATMSCDDKAMYLDEARRRVDERNELDKISENNYRKRDGEEQMQKRLDEFVREMQKRVDEFVEHVKKCKSG